MDEDEETVLENSPLDVYLQNVSNLEFTKHKSFDENFEERPMNETYDDDMDFNNKSENTGTSIFCQNEFISNSDIIKAITVLFECVALNDRDKYILHKIEEYTNQQLHDILVEKTTKLKALYLFFYNNIYYFIAFIIAVISLPMPWLFFFSHYEELFVLALIVVGGLIYIVLSPKQSDISTMLLKELVALSELTENLELLIKKSMNHIREIDVVMNGYFNTTIHKSFLHTKNQENSKSKKVKKFLYDKLFECFSVIRSRERIIIQNSSFREIDVAKDEYIAEMSINLITELLKNKEVIDNKSVNENKTEDLHMDSVKQMIHLHREQCSEFIYSCILALHSMDYQEIHELKTVVFGVADINKILTNATKDIEKMLDSSIDMLFSHHIPTTSKSLETSSNSQDDFIHSAKLNLHSALYRLDEMAEASCNNEETDFLISSVSQFNILLENAKSCINEIIALKKTNEKDNTIVNENDEIINSVENKDVIYNVTTEPPEEIGDQLLEGKGSEESENMATPIVEEEKHVTENSRKLMRELKCILSVKNSPEGLISFPLDQSIQKLLPEKIESIQKLPPEEIETEDLPPFKVKEIKSSYDAKEYYGDSMDGDDTSTIENIKNIPFSLPSNFLSQFKSKSNDLLDEEIFGEVLGDDEIISDDVTVSDDVIGSGDLAVNDDVVDDKINTTKED